LGEEDEGGKAVLGASSERVGVAPSSGERRRCWLLGAEHGKERKSKRDEGKGRGGSGVARRGCSRESSWRWSGKQEVATLAPAQDTHEVAAYWKKKKEGFAENPLGLGRFQGKKLKQRGFARFGTLNGVQKF
jgi:hypothetical protein